MMQQVKLLIGCIMIDTTCIKKYTAWKLSR